MKKSKLDPINELFSLVYQDFKNLKVDLVVHILMPLLMIFLSYITMLYIVQEYKSSKSTKQD